MKRKAVHENRYKESIYCKKELGENGRFILRWYSAEPKIAVLIEALTMEECEAYLERFMTYLRNHGYLD